MLSITQLLWFLEVLEVQVIGVNDCLVGVSMKVVSPFSKGSHNHKQFLIVHLVLSFCQIERLREEKATGCRRPFESYWVRTAPEA